MCPHYESPPTPEIMTACQGPVEQQPKVPENTGLCWWDELPRECKLQVWEHLTAREVARAAGICREFAAYAHETRLGTRTLKLPAGVSATALQGMVKAFSRASKVRVHPSLVHMPTLGSAIARGAQARVQGAPLESLDLSNCRSLSEHSLLSLFTTIPSIRDLDLSNCVEVSDASLKALAASIRRTDCDADEDGLAWEALQMQEALQPRTGATARVHIEDAFAAARHAHSPLADGFGSPGGHNLMGGFRHRPGLRALSVDACSQVTAVGALEILKACSHSLTSFNVSRTAVSSLQQSRWGALQSLTANQCDNLTSVTFQLPASAPLRELSLAGCTNLGKVVLACPQLISLNVSGNSSLTHLSLKCTALESLRAAQCLRLEGLQEGFCCPALLHANFAGCRSLTGLDESLAGCTSLLTLNVNGCISLFRLALLDHTGMARLEASGCKQLRTVECGSTALEVCMAQSCQVLEALRLQGKSLQVLDVGGCSSLRELQMSWLDRPMADLMATANSRKGALHLNIDGCPLLPTGIVSRLQAAFKSSRRMKWY
ncbi:probable EIN3-binding F-box protein 1 [Coccomyxa sp. Obi]|nr:probable EIN3-binding F-box protein 1 [Coccomyxa sp. Obi]